MNNKIESINCTDQLYKGFHISKIINSLSNENWKLILLPTERCNFKCMYCYENHALGQMTENTVNAVKKLIARRLETKELKYFNIAWFGGEPLLSKEIISNINGYVKKIADQRVLFSSNITTNGYLLDQKTFENLLALQINYYQISLDGDRDFHDKVRCKINGNGTFDKIWENLLNIKKCDAEFSIILRLHVHSENIFSMQKLVCKIKDAFSDDNRFKVFIRPISKLGGTNDDQVKSPSDVISIIHKFYAMLDNKVSLWDTGSTIQGQYICYAAQPNSLVIRPNGSLAKCTVALDTNINNIGKLNDDGTLSIINDKFQSWVEGFKEINNLLKCPYYNRKHSFEPKCGKCNFSNYDLTGRG
ncbi:MAG: hypothetical protein A2X78_01950 [Gammaproteobacteria bacterium GWE2_37_16]|nr:MAG: hypothetical protein A2X78_01950 [Gammaproteobacteria bacterium GWE2_37_16]